MGGPGGCTPPSIWEFLQIWANSGKVFFGQIWAKFRILLVFCIGFFGHLFYFFWARNISPPPSSRKWPSTPMICMYLSIYKFSVAHQSQPPSKIVKISHSASHFLNFYKLQQNSCLIHSTVLFKLSCWPSYCVLRKLGCTNDHNQAFMASSIYLSSF